MDDHELVELADREYIREIEDRQRFKKTFRYRLGTFFLALSLLVMLYTGLAIFWGMTNQIRQMGFFLFLISHADPTFIIGLSLVLLPSGVMALIGLRLRKHI